MSDLAQPQSDARSRIGWIPCINALTGAARWFDGLNRILAAIACVDAGPDHARDLHRDSSPGRRSIISNPVAGRASARSRCSISRSWARPGCWGTTSTSRSISCSNVHRARRPRAVPPSGACRCHRRRRPASSLTWFGILTVDRSVPVRHPRAHHHGAVDVLDHRRRAVRARSCLGIAVRAPGRFAPRWASPLDGQDSRYPR